MIFRAQWLTSKGTITDDNRDYCAVALRGSEALYVVVDGSTQGDQSGALAETFVRALADRFIAEPLLGSADDILGFLAALCEDFKALYPAGRLSFLIVLDLGGSSVYALHAGDCRLGRIDVDDGITWLSRVHTLANAVEDIGEEQLRAHVDRHVLARSFRPGRPCEVEVRQYSLMANDRLIIATDGYWADLDHPQKSGFIDKSFVPTAPHRDDVSCLLLSRLPEGSDEEAFYQGAENFYLVTA